MSKKKILSILIISLIVLGVFTFVLTNYLHASCASDFEWCWDWCGSHVSDPVDWHHCVSQCGVRYSLCI